MLRKLYPKRLFVEINPADAERLQIAPGERVVVKSQRGRIEARAFLTPSIQQGQLFVAMHDHTVNRLTDAVFDPHSKQPSYKACAVQVMRQP